MKVGLQFLKINFKNGEQLYLRETDALGKAVFYCPAAVPERGVQ